MWIWELLSDISIKEGKETNQPLSMDFMEKEYHPVIEEYVVDYVDEKLTATERDAFEEVLVSDDDLRELAFSSKDGRRLMELLRVLRKVGI